MTEKYQAVQWVVQQNLTSQSDFAELKASCEAIGVSFIGINIIPFSEVLPNFDKSRRSITYGSTTFNSLALKNSSLVDGTFFDEVAFSIENYNAKWGHNMLNYEASILTFEELMKSNLFASEKLLFIRPNDDNKSFAGETKRFDEIKDWYARLRAVDNGSLSLDSKVVVSEPYNIQYEWRLWIVNKKVVAASKYREYFKLKKEEGCPEEVTQFAERMCQIYTPHDVFVMDVCLCGDEYFIVECGCMNGAGFYKANIRNIVSSVTDYVVSKSLT